jgi:hypothetical protein
VDDQGSEHQACLGARKLDGTAVYSDLERTKDPYLHEQTFACFLRVRSVPVVFKSPVEDEARKRPKGWALR